ncbi:hypothetical protein [Pseudothermotoga sp.]
MFFDPLASALALLIAGAVLAPLAFVVAVLENRRKELEKKRKQQSNKQKDKEQKDEEH